MDDNDKMPFTDHLEELRKRMIICFAAVAVGFAVCYNFKQQIFDVVTKPLMDVMPEGETLIFTGLPEPFFAYLKVSFFAGVILALPVIMWQVWKFVSPGLYTKERRMLLPLVILSCFFFAAGTSFGYFLVFPFGFQFFLEYGGESIKALPSVKEYLSLATKLLLAFGIVFQLPLFITVFARMGLVTVPWLKKNRKYALVVFLVGAALITPPDVITQLMMAGPLMVLYEISIWGAMVFGKKNTSGEETQEDPEEDPEEDSGPEPEAG